MNNEPIYRIGTSESSLSSDVARDGNENWLSMSEAAPLTPYSAEYLSLLARKKKLPSKKIQNTWYTTKPALKEYMDKQMLRTQVQNGSIHTLEKLRSFQGDIKKYEEKEASKSLFEDSKIENPPSHHLLISELKHAFEKMLDKKIPDNELPPSRKLENTNVKNIPEKTKHSHLKIVFSSKILVVSAIILFILLSILPIPVVLSFMDRSLGYVKKALNDTNTVMGFRPGTHENELLLLDEAGNISIMGDIETEGQLRSYAPQGVAPLFVESTTTVENLSADYLDNYSAGDFTLDFVVGNGSATNRNVSFGGEVGIGKLFVSGAAEFRQSLDVFGRAYFESLVTLADDLSVKGNVDVGKNIFARGSIEAGSSVLGRSGSFGSLSSRGDFSAGGKITLGNEDDVLTVNAENITIDKDGNARFDGSVVATSFSGSSINVTNASSTNATSTNSTTTNAFISSLVAGNATSTNFFSTTGVFTNLSADSQAITDLTFVNATGTSATTSNFFTDNLSALIGRITSIVADDVSVGALTATDAIVTNSTTTNATSTNFFSSNIFGTIANITGAIFGDSTTTNATSTNSFVESFSSIVGRITSFFADDADIGNLTVTNSTTTNATTTALFSTTASSTNLFSTTGNIGTLTAGPITSGLINGQTISSAANFTGTLTATGGLTTLSNLLLTGSSTLQNLTFVNATGTNATTTNFYSSNTITGPGSFTVNSSGNVGVGTASPSNPLHILSSASTQLRVERSTVGGQASFILENGDDNTAEIVLSGAEEFTFKNGGTSVLTMLASGNVGIGTTNPSRLLHILGSNASDTQIEARIENTGAGAAGLSLKNTSSSVGSRVVRLQHTADRIDLGYFDETTSGLTRNVMSWLQSGNVGIGTTNPSYKLSIENNGALFGVGTASAGYPRVYLGGTDPSTAGVINRITGSEALYFGEDTDTGITRFRSTGVTTFNGGVGIGTTTPSAKLHLSGGNGTNPSVLTGTQMIIQNNANATDRSRLSIVAGNTTGAAASLDFGTSVSQARGYVFYNTATDLMTLGAGGIDTLHITGGNVGIGTTNPSEKLYVSGNAIISGNSTTTNATTTALFSTTASSTNLFSTTGNIGTLTAGPITSGLINGQTISSAANFTGTLTATGGLTTLSNLLLTGSSTLQNLTFVNATGTSATTTNFFSTNLSGTNLNFSNFSFTNATGTSATTTNFYSNYGTFEALGIGTSTSTPGALHTTGDAYIGGALTIAGSLTSSITNGQIQFLAIPQGTAINQGTVYINPASAGTNNVLLGLAVNGTEKARIDAEGDIQIIGTFNSTNTTGTNSLSGHLSVLGNTTFGNASSDILTINSEISSNLIPSADNTYTLGSSLKRWNSFHATTAVFNEIETASSTLAAFIINSDNVSADEEDATLEFHRGTLTPNATIKWDSAGDYFVFNYPISTSGSVFGVGTASSSFAGPLWVTGPSQGTGLRDASLYVNPSSGPTNYSLFSVAVNDVERFRIDAEGDTTIQGSLGVENALYDISQDTLTINDKLQLNGGEIKDSAGTTRLSIGAANAFTGTLAISSLTSGRVPFISTGGLLSDSSAFLWDNSLSRLTATHASTTVISSSGSAYLATGGGNVGIGTTNPQTKLDILGAANANLITARTATNRLAEIGGDATPDGLFRLYNSSDVLMVDIRADANNTYFNGGGNVGIGTTNPVNKLHVSGGASASIIRLTNTASGATLADGLAAILDSDGANTSLWNYEDGYLRFGTNNVERARITTNGNFGIGTSPSSLLHISGATPKFQLTDTDTGADSFIDAASANGAIGILADENNEVAGSYINFRVDGSEKVRIDANGAVGIGTTSPGGKLDVSSGGTAGILLGADEGLTSRTNITDKKARFAMPHYTNAEEPVALIFGNSISGQNIVTIGGGTSQLNAATSLAFNTAANSTTVTGTTRMVIDNLGNVGIGTTTPNNKLDVNGTLGVVNGTGRYLTIVQSGTDVTYETNDKHWFKTDTSVRASINDGGLSVGSTYYSTDAPANGAIIQGNVGIGTTTPGALLDIYGSNPRPRITNTNSVLDGSLRFYENSTAVAGINAQGSAFVTTDRQSDLELFTFNGGDISFWPNSGQTAVFKASGNVGIGTTTPQNKLHVEGSGTQAYFGNGILSGSGAAGAIKIGDSTITKAFGAGFIFGSGLNPDSDDNRAIGTLSARWNSIRIGTGESSFEGNVGIGVTNPGSRLHVYQVDPSTGNAIVRIQGIGDQGEEAGLTYYAPYGTDSTNRAGRIYTAFDGASYTGARLTLQSMTTGDTLVDTLSLKNGNVGIGTTNPGAKLEIVGGNILLSNGYGLNIKRADSTAINVLEIPTGTNDLQMKIPGSASANKFNIINTGLTNLVTVQGDGNVGIGTTTPQYALEVKSGGVTPAHFESASGQSAALTLSTPSSSGYSRFYTRRAGTFIGSVGSDADGVFGLSSGSGTANHLSIHSSGNVGIGTTTPLGKLSVTSGTENNQGGFLVAPSTFSNRTLRIDGNKIDVLLTTTQAVDSAAHLLLQSTSGAGNVGIGTTNPTQKLDVVGNVLVTPGTGGVVIDQNNSNIGLTVTGGGAGVDIARFVRDVGADATFGINGSAGDSQVYFATTGNTFSVGVDGANFKISDNSTLGTNDRLTIDTSGNVGIGTTTPYARLSVEHLSSTGTVIGADSLTGFTGNLLDLKVASSTKFSVNQSGDLFSSGSTTLQNFTFVNATGTSATTTNFFSTTASSTNLFSSLLTVGGNTLVTTSSGNVGIGTTGPAQKLDIVGDTSSNGIQLRLSSTNTDTTTKNARIVAGTYTNSNNPLLLIGSGANSGSNPVYIGGIPGASAVTAATNLSFVTASAINTAGGTERMTITSSGNVGIGTTTPDAKLGITGGGVGTGRALAVKDSANVDKFTVLDNGNVSIYGTLSFTGSAVYDAINLNNNSVVGVNLLTIADAGAGEGLGWADNSWKVDVSPLDRSNAVGNLNLYNTTNNIALWRPSLWVYNASNYTTATAQSDGGLNFTTTGSGHISFNPGGNVGIGTTNPTQKLEVSGNILVTGNATATNATTTSFFANVLDAVTARITSLISDEITVGALTATTAEIGNSTTTNATTTNSYFSNSLTGPGSFTVNSSGNVGIGTTNPGNNKLTIVGSSSTTTPQFSINPGGAIGDSAALMVNNRAKFGYDGLREAVFIDDAAANKNIVFDTSGLERMRITTAGNVGIGTTTPGRLLEISSNNTGGTIQRISNTDTGGRQWELYSTGSTNSMGAGSFVIYDNTAGASRITVNTSGNVGIGTTTPNNLLDIYSTSKSAIGFSGASGSTYKWTVGMDVANGGRFSIASSTALGTIDRFVIDGNGNVGVGTTSPLYRLDVASSSATDVIVTYSGAASGTHNISADGPLNLTTAGSYTISFNTGATVRIKGVAGGGGGGSGTEANQRGGGGGEGGAVNVTGVTKAVVATSYSANIGAGGTGGPANGGSGNGTAGTAGGTTNFESDLTLTGGNGGAGGTSGSPGAGGTGGSTSGGDGGTGSTGASTGTAGSSGSTGGGGGGGGTGTGGAGGNGTDQSGGAGGSPANNGTSASGAGGSGSPSRGGGGGGGGGSLFGVANVGGGGGGGAGGSSGAGGNGGSGALRIELDEGITAARVAGNIMLSASGNADLIIKSTTATGDNGLFRIRSAGSSNRLDILNKSTNLLSITDEGYVGIGTTNPALLDSKVVKFAVVGNSGGNSWVQALKKTNTDLAAQFTIFIKHDGTTMGYISSSDGNNVALTSVSDERLKENIVDTDTGLDTLNKIHVRDFNFISDETKTKLQGFVAQELYEIYPHAVVVGGDDASSNPWAVNYAGLTPILVKSIQELSTQFVELNGKFATILDDTWSFVLTKLTEAGVTIEENLVRISNLFATTLYVENKLVIDGEICVDDVCISKEQFKQMLLSAGGVQTVSALSDNSSEESEETETASTTPSITASSTQEVVTDDQETASSTPEVIEENPSSSGQTATTTEPVVEDEPEVVEDTATTTEGTI